MKCPHCQAPLLMTERKGVEIDYCGQCRGVWLDKGELDKIIDLTLQERLAAARPRDRASVDAHPQYTYSKPEKRSGTYGHDPYAKPGYGYHKPYYKKKKKGMLGELFDIFD